MKHGGGSMMLNITFMVASLANPHFTWSLNFAGQAPQGAILFFAFLIMDLMVFHGMFKVLDYFI